MAAITATVSSVRGNPLQNARTRESCSLLNISPTHPCRLNALQLQVRLHCTTRPTSRRNLLVTATSLWDAITSSLTGGQNSAREAALAVRRGMQLFVQGDVEQSMVEFDKAIELDPRQKKYLWQRGLSLYYLNRFEEGGTQFRDDVAANPNDTEESIWCFLCEAQLHGVDEARRRFLEKMVPSLSERAEISKEMEVYRMAGGTLSFDMAVQDRTTKMSDAWWRSYGGRLPKLQKLAIRILSQTCSASGCERNWSVFEKIHTKRRNRLEGQRLNDMVYVYYNLRLWVRQLERTPDMEAISLDAIDTTAEWRVEAERPVMELAPDWIEEEVVEGEDEEEDEEEQQEEEVTPPTTTTGRGRGLPPLAPSGSGSRSGSGASFFSSRARQSPLPVPPASSSREKGKAVVFSRKRGRGNQ